jgi:uncharacterized membrane-anchored protein
MADKKGKKVKMTEAEKRERVAQALAKKKEVEARALEIVHREAGSRIIFKKFTAFWGLGLSNDSGVSEFRGNCVFNGNFL